MNTIIKYLLLGFLVAASFMPRQAHADLSCTSFLTVYFNPPDGVAMIDETVAVGQPVWSGTVNFPTADLNYGCSDPTIGGIGYGWHITEYIGAGTYRGNNVYDSGIAGLGYKIYSTGGCVSGYYPLTCPYDNRFTNLHARQYTVTLIKTSATMAESGQLSGVFAIVNTRGKSGNFLGVMDKFVWSIPFQVKKMVKPTCAVDDRSVLVPMGSVSNPKLSVGQTFNPVDFSLKLNCSGGDGTTPINAYLTLTDSTTPGNRSSTLNLGTGSTVTGLGIQILRNNTPVSFGPADGTTVGSQNQFSVGATTNGSITIPFTGQYIVTNTNVTPGIVKAVALFTVVYQ